ncbi:endoglucanase 14-like protein [Tanacetum coccineum]
MKNESLQVNLVGGYHDAGDNVKFGFPMAYTITMLAWGVVEFHPYLRKANELENAYQAIKWGANYLIKAHPSPNVLYAAVGDGMSDHECWQRPEDMTTPRTPYKIDHKHPGADIAGETAAAFAASSIAFKYSDPGYSNILLKHAKQLFDFAQNNPGVYSDSIPAARHFYPSSGYQDELLWAAAWLYRATNNKIYADFIANATYLGGTRSMFSWDDKFVGFQVLIAREVLSGGLHAKKLDFKRYIDNAEEFICNCVGIGNSNVMKTKGGLLWFTGFGNLQYVNSASFVISAYADYIAAAKLNLVCSGGTLAPPQLIRFAESQMDYILGMNPKGMSYMVGYGSNYPKKVHHRAASIVSIKKYQKFVTCEEGFAWMKRSEPNPNVVEGAVVGGPDQDDNHEDSRENFQQNEPATATNAPIVGVLARLI